MHPCNTISQSQLTAKCTSSLRCPHCFSILTLISTSHIAVRPPLSWTSMLVLLYSYIKCSFTQRIGEYPMGSKITYTMYVTVWNTCLKITDTRTISIPLSIQWDYCIWYDYHMAVYVQTNIMVNNIMSALHRQHMHSINIIVAITISK